jgi:nitroreductase
MMDAWDAVVSRRNVREFKRDPIPPDDLDRILEAARRTPSSRNLQPWDFVVVTDRGQLERLAGVWRGAWHVAGAAAAIALIAPKPDDESRNWLYYDLGQASMSIMLAATGLGLGTGHAAVADQGVAREVLGFPEDRFCAAVISVGYPADRPLRPIAEPKRRPFDEVVHRERW